MDLGGLKLNKGFVLMEVMVTTVILAVGCLSIVHVLSNTLQTQRVANEFSNALLFYEERIFEKQVLGNFPDGTLPAVSSGAIKLEESASPLNPERYPGLYQIQTTVSHPSTKIPSLEFVSVMKRDDEE
jgi:prepilin-type N-terminal cleavage/methylation domain-containing protein